MMNKNNIILFLVLFAGQTLQAQVYVRTSMGISFFTAPALTDYLNFNFAPPEQKLNTFSTQAEFGGEAGYISGGYVYAVELAYLLNSYNFPYIANQYTFSYGILSPSVIVSTVSSGPGYSFRLGVGVGPRFTSVDETIPGTNVIRTYSATGAGLLVKAEGNTGLSQNVYAYIAGDIRYDMNGEPKNNGKGMKTIFTPEDLSLNMFSFGVKLGVSYFF